MTFAPPPLKALGAYWTKQGGVNLGVVGDTAHQRKGVSYHLGKDNLLPGAYSARTVRDRRGLSNAASAIDLGRLDGSLTKLWEFSKWFTNRCMDNDPRFRDVREVIYWSPERGRVVGWSDTNTGSNQLINDYGDLSHKTHTHISFYRDSEDRDKIPMFAAYPEFKPATPPPPPTAQGEPMLSAYLPGYIAMVKPTSNVRATPTLNGTVIRVVGALPEPWTIVGRVKGAVDPEGGSDQWYLRWNAGRYEYTAFSNVPVAPVAPVTPARLAQETAKVTASATALAATKTDLAKAEARAKTAIDVLTP